MKRGSTLVETILYTFLLLSFLTLITQLIATVLDVQKESSAASLSSQDAMFIMQKMTNEIFQADQILSPPNPGDSQSQLQLDVNGQTRNFQLSASDLIYDSGAASGKLNSYGTVLNSFTVKRIGNPGGKHAVSIEFELRSLIEESGGTRTGNYHFTAGLR